MSYEKEFDFLKDVFAKFCLKLTVLDDAQFDSALLDLGMYTLVWQETPMDILRMLFHRAKPQTIYRVKDAFLCTYICFVLPQKSKTLAIIGPYLTEKLSREALLKQIEPYEVSATRLSVIEKYYSTLPVVESNSIVYAMLDVFAERMWGSGNYMPKNADLQLPFLSDRILVETKETEIEDNVLLVRAMEQKYAYENELVQAVFQGKMYREDLMLGNISALNFEQNGEDSLRLMKNHCIEMNALLRKAAEQGGVHPIYIEEVSSAFSQKIEALSSMQDATQLIQEMYNSYCRLVNKNAIAHYSPLIQNTILYIDTNLSGDLRLKVLSQQQNINASYLSSLFKKETGQTITDYVNNCRIQHALHLLSATKLKIQTVAQSCGMTDVNYFSKLFKKYTHKTPYEYRKEQQNKKENG